MQRDQRLDTVKGLLIILVVIGHSIENFVFQCDTTATLVYNAIYSFHMPLFVLLSGYFFNPDKSWRDQKKRLGMLMETLLVYQFIHMVLFPSESESIIRSLLTPGWTLWYLLSLIVWSLTAFILQKRYGLMKNCKTIFIISIAISVVTAYIPLTNEMAFHRTIGFWPFFIMGVILKNKTIKNLRHLISLKHRLLLTGGVF